jgi:hypothetical protein
MFPCCSLPYISQFDYHKNWYKLWGQVRTEPDSFRRPGGNAHSKPCFEDVVEGEYGEVWSIFKGERKWIFYLELS